ncbi:MAG: arylformamidase [Elusimicrobia bacterium RIFCSPLOWO2_01_FULL_60_11]|nr:MAG: arylformamidase [Elusimicrobia bacterium RIFCSPLOWO2_01_FULL_60_11]
MKRLSRWQDVSVPLQDGMVHWPGDPEVRIKVIHDIKKGDACTVRHLSMGSHTGTHMDAPSHFLRGARAIDKMPFEATVGPARVIPIHHKESITVRELERHRILKGERILFKTRNSGSLWKKKKFAKDFVYISKDAAAYLAGRKIRMVGVDYLSVGGFYADGPAIHRQLLQAGVWIVEGLDLKRIPPGRYDLVCLPLKLREGDGAPARAILRRI